MHLKLKSRRPLRGGWCSLVMISHRQENTLARAEANFLPLQGMVFNLRVKLRYYISLKKDEKWIRNADGQLTSSVKLHARDKKCKV